MAFDSPAWSDSLLAWAATLFLAGFCLCLITYNPSALAPVIRTITRRPTQPLHQKIDSLCREGKDYFIEKLRKAMRVEKPATIRRPGKMPSSAIVSLSNLKTASHGYAHHATSLASETGQEKRVLPQSVLTIQNMTNNIHTNSHVNQENLAIGEATLVKHSMSPVTVLPLPIYAHSHTSAPALPTTTGSDSNIMTVLPATHALNAASGSNSNPTTASGPPQTPGTDASRDRVLRRSLRVRIQTTKGMESEKQTKRYTKRRENGM